jgi:hypothetical protein
MTSPSASAGGRSAFPQIRFVALVENGTHVLFGTQMARYDTGENTLARQLRAKDALPSLQPGMLADRQFFCFSVTAQDGEVRFGCGELTR